MTSRPPLECDSNGVVTSEEFSLAADIVRRSGLVGLLEGHLRAATGRPRQLSLEGLLVAMQVNALRRHHKAHLIEVARVLNAMTDEQRQRLGMVTWDPEEAYPRTDSLFCELAGLLDSGTTGLDPTAFANRLAQAAIPRTLLRSGALAVDGTDVETWAKLRGTSFTIELDGEAADTQLIEEPLPRPRARVRTAKVLAIGPDGRKQYTKDPDARAGHRSATSQRLAGPYVGYELHLGVLTREVKWTNYRDRTTLGEDVPNVITTLNLVPAGSHRARSIVGELVETRARFHEITEVVWDPGYSLCQPETTTYRLGRAGISQTLQLTTHQRGIRPFSGEALLLDGQLYSRFLPAELRDLAMPPRSAPGPYRRTFEEKFNQRARWRLVRHSAPDGDGYTRWRCPFCAGLLRSRRLPRTMRRSRRAPLVALPDGITACCKGTLSAPAAELPLAQKIPFGTTAWRISMDRRQVVESANAALKGGFVDLARGFFRVFGTGKITILLGFTAAAYNLDRIRSFRARKEAENRAPKFPKRRLGTWARPSEGIGSDPEPRSTGPPG